jgi:hypothetical protein
MPSAVRAYSRPAAPPPMKMKMTAAELMLPAYSDRQPGSSRPRQRAAPLALTGTGCGVGGCRVSF